MWLRAQPNLNWVQSHAEATHVSKPGFQCSHGFHQETRKDVLATASKDRVWDDERRNLSKYATSEPLPEHSETSPLHVI